MSEDENGLQTEKPQKKSLPKRLFKFTFKFTFYLGVLLFMSLTALTFIGGNSDTLKGAVEEVLTIKSGYHAKINEFGHMKFFPYISIDASNIEFFEALETAEVEQTQEQEQEAETPQAPKELVLSDKPVMSIEKLRLDMSFFALAFANGYIKNIELKNLKANAGTLLPKALAVEYVFFNEEKAQENKVPLSIKASIEQTPITANIGFERVNSGAATQYKLAEERPLEAKIGAISITANMKPKVLGGFELADLMVSNNENVVLKGTLNLQALASSGWDIDGDLVIEPNKTQIEPDLSYSEQGETKVVKGTLKAKRLHLSDVDGQSALMKTINTLNALVSTDKGNSGDFEFSDLDIDIALDIEELRSGAVNLGEVKAPLLIKNKILTLDPISGKISQGDLTGDFEINAAQDPATMSMQINVKKFNHGALQEQVMPEASLKGSGDFALNMKTQGRTVDQMLSAMDGHFSFVAGQGQMKTGLLELWGGGLLNAMLPSFSPQEELNVGCAVLDLNLKGSLAEIKTMLLDTKRISVTGAGDYDVVKDALDLKISPKAKDVSIGNISTGVVLSGSLSNPTIRPSIKDVSKKIGGLLLGAVNPAFYAVTLVGVSLDDDHPCKAFVIEKQQLEQPKQEQPQKAESNEAKEAGVKKDNQEGPKE